MDLDFSKREMEAGMVLYEIILYEIKARKKSILFLAAELAMLAAVSVIMWRFPACAVSIANAINKSDFAMGFFGMEERIENVRYIDIMFSVLLLLTPIVILRNMTDMAKAVKREKYMGTGLFFQTQSVHESKLLLCKLFVGIVLLVAEAAVIGIFVWRFSLVGASDIEVLNVIISERVFKALKAFFFIGVFSLAAGFAYGCISDAIGNMSFAFNFLAVGYFMALIPNIFKGAIGALKPENINTGWIDGICGFFSKVRKYDILYYGNPFIGEKGIAVRIVLIYMAVIAVMLLAGVIVYNRKDK